MDRQVEGPRSEFKRTTKLILAVTLHNIPEGMAVSVPLISGGMTKWKAVLITAATGIPTILIIGPDGTILSRGKQDDELRADVKAVMEGTLTPDSLKVQK